MLDTQIDYVLKFETYLLMGMKTRLAMAKKQNMIDAKLDEFSISLSDAEYIRARFTDLLAEETNRFANLNTVLGMPPLATSISYHSILWPGFIFKATASKNGALDTAGYRHIPRAQLPACSPADLTLWSVDPVEFAQLYGPVKIQAQWPLFDHILPAYDEYSFTWNNESYGARFVWGLFFSSSISWD